MMNQHLTVGAAHRMEQRSYEIKRNSCGSYNVSVDGITISKDVPFIEAVGMIESDRNVEETDNG